jgi:hypothetical protein
MLASNPVNKVTECKQADIHYHMPHLAQKKISTLSGSQTIKQGEPNSVYLPPIMLNVNSGPRAKLLRGSGAGR